MARTVIPFEPLATNTAISGPTGTTLAVGNDGYYLAGSAGTPEQVIFSVAFTGATGTVVVVAGDNPPALAAGQGDLSTAGYNTTKIFGPFESSRFLQSDGTVSINFTGAAATGTAIAYKVPRV